MKPLNEMTAAELQAELDLRKESEKAESAKRRKAFEREKDNFALNAANTFLDARRHLSALKTEVIGVANKLYEDMYAINDREPKEVNSFSLKNERDTVKVTVDRQERFEFTEEATVHINAIKDIFKKKFAGRNKGLYNILDGLLIKGSKGEYDPKLLAKARRQVRELGDEALIDEFDKLDGCQKVVGTSQYVRVHVRDEKGKWKDVSLQFSSL